MGGRKKERGADEVGLMNLRGFEGKMGIQTWLGLARGEAVGDLRDTKSFAELRDSALTGLQSDAHSRKADAVVGVTVDVVTGGHNNNTVIVSAYGTAVRIG